PSAIVAVDAPVSSEGVDDVESVSSAVVGVGDTCEPGAAAVFDFNPCVVPWDDLGAYGEFPARFARVAVHDGVGGQLRCAQDHIVSSRAIIKKTLQVRSDLAYLLGAGWVGGVVYTHGGSSGGRQGHKSPGPATCGGALMPSKIAC